MTKFEEKLAQIIRERQGHLPSVNSEEVLHILANELLATLDAVDGRKVNVSRFERLAKPEEKPVNKELEEEYHHFLQEEWFNKPGKTVSEMMFLTAKHFAHWQQQQLMKDAVEGEVCDGYKYLPHAAIIINKNYIKPLKTGDKIKLIIVKED